MPLGGETLEMETNSMEDQKHIIRRDTEIKRKFNLTAIELFTYIKVFYPNLFAVHSGRRAGHRLVEPETIERKKEIKEINKNPSKFKQDKQNAYKYTPLYQPILIQSSNKPDTSYFSASYFLNKLFII